MDSSGGSVGEPAEAEDQQLPSWWSGPRAAATRIEKRGSLTRRTWLFGLAVVAAALFTVLGQLDRILVEGGYPNPSGGGITSLHKADSVGDWGTAATAGLPKGAEAAVEAARIHESPRTIAAVYIVLDFLLLIAAYTTLLALLALRLRARLRDGAPWEKALRRVLEVALTLTVALAYVDLLETGLQGLILLRIDLLAPLVPWLSFAKFTLLVLVVLACAGAAVRLARNRWAETTRGVLRTAAVLRFQIVAVALLALLLHASPQAADAILRWGVSDGWWIVAVGVGLTLLLATALFVTARNSAYADESDDRAPLPPRVLGGAGIVLMLGAVVVGFGGDREGAGLFVLGGLLFVIALLSTSRVIEGPDPNDPDPPECTSQHAADRRATVLLPALLAAAAPLLLGLAILVATTGQLALFGVFAQLHWAAVAVVGVGLLATSTAIFNRALVAGERAGKVGSGGILVAGVTALGIAIAIYTIGPWWPARVAGAVGVVAAFLIALAIAGWAVEKLERRWGPPAALALAGFHRLPVITLLLVAAIGTMVIDDRGDHAVRTVAASPVGGKPPVPVKATHAFERWRLANRPERRRVTPLVFVAASGGGVRAAYWTARVLRCAVERLGPPGACKQPGGAELTQPVFVASGVSGGSLGLASYAARLGADRSATGGPALASDYDPVPGDWVAERLGDDFLAPTVAWMLFADIPKAIAGVRLGGDRASILEQAWERSWDEERDAGPLTAGLRASWAADRRLPLLVLNGTDVSRACRVSTSVLDADVEDRDELSGRNPVTADCQSQETFVGASPADRRAMRNWALPASHDLVDQLDCEEGNERDVRLSTAALLSARFPYVSPSGRVGLCDDEEAIDVVDGGYIENSGASTALEIWQRVAPDVDAFHAANPGSCIAPVFVQVDNDYVRDRKPGAASAKRPIEPLVPPRVFTRVRHGNAASARQASALAFAGSRQRGRRLWLGGDRVDRYVHVYPSFHPGTKAPLGWTLSAPSMKSLDDQLGTQRRNTRALATIRSWFDPRISCTRPN